MTIVASEPAASRPAEPARRFVDVSPRRLVELLYGAVTGPDDLAELTVIASATGTDPLDLVATTGEVGEDPRSAPSNPRAVYTPDVDTEVDEEMAAKREVPAGLAPSAAGKKPGDIEEDHDEEPSGDSRGDDRPVVARPRSLFAAAASLTSDLIEVATRGRRDLAAWAHRVLSHRDATLPRLTIGSPATTGMV